MKMDMKTVLHIFWNTFVSLLWIFVHTTGTELSECLNPQMVHASDLQIMDKVYVDGEYCKCESSVPAAKDDSKSKFSWYHYQRTDWVLHFHFCYPVMSSRMCTPEEQQGIVATIVVDEDKWNPSKDTMQCHCGTNKTYYMHSWKLHTDKDNKAGGQWKYHFTCDSKLCKPGQACVKHYLDHAASHTSGFGFMCHCAEGSYCPVGNGGQKIQSYDVDGKDDTGPFINSFCTDLPGWKKPTGEGNGAEK